MKRVLSIEEINPGDVLWAYARGYWRQVRVVATGRRRATVAYTIHAGSASATRKVQALSVERFRHDRPVGFCGVLDVEAPAAAIEEVRS